MPFRTKLTIVLCALYGAGCSNFSDFSGTSLYDTSSFPDTFSEVETLDSEDSAFDMTEEEGGFVSGPIQGSSEDFALMAGERIYFDLDGYDLDDEDRAVLQRQAQWLLSYPNAQILVGGHCDERGTRDYNLALGARRANTAKEYLESLGIESSRIRTISYGKERPLDEGHNEVAWGINRNAHTQVMEDMMDMDDS